MPERKKPETRAAGLVSDPRWPDVVASDEAQSPDHRQPQPTLLDVFGLDDYFRRNTSTTSPRPCG